MLEKFGANVLKRQDDINPSYHSDNRNPGFYQKLKDGSFGWIQLKKNVFISIMR